MKQADIRKQILVSLSTSRLAIPLIISTLVGTVTGFVIVIFVSLIDMSEGFFFDKVKTSLGFVNGYGIILIPALGGLIVGLLTKYFGSEAKGHGVPEVMKAIALHGGRMRPLTVVIKLIASVISIGSGASVGREGPAVQIGAGLGSSIARIFKLSESRIKNLLACGAAAGISAVFNAPITGVMFALEVLLKDFGARALSTVVVASVSGSIISRVFLGVSPAFSVPVYKLWSPWEMILYAGLGIFSALVALLFIVTLDRSDRFFEEWRLPEWSKPVLGGLMIGAIGFYVPHIFGMGFHVIENILHGNLSLKLLLLLIFLKILASSISLGSGSSGGSFAPTLFVGASMGGLFGKLFFNHLPFPMAPPGAYALVGMASVFAAAFHAPVTAILLVFEMTGDYQMILPIMIASVIAASLSQIVMRESIDTVKLKRQGLDVDAMEEVKVLGAIQVRDAMSKDFVTLPREMPAKEMVEKVSKLKGKTVYVVDHKEELVGVIRREEMQEVLLEKDLSLLIVDDVASPIPEYCFPDEPLSEASRMMMSHKLTQLPVVQPSDEKKIVGVLKSEDVFRAYTQETVKRADMLSRIEQEGAHASGTIQIRFTIPLRSSLNGKAIKELDIPEGVVLTSVLRKNSTLVPEGHTVLKSKDKIWAVLHPQASEPFMNWLRANKLQRYVLGD